MDLDREIQLKKEEIATLSQMLSNTKHDLRILEQRRKEQSSGKSGFTKMDT
jgi:hypothetical protein